jgi:hypothetical protein
MKTWKLGGAAAAIALAGVGGPALAASIGHKVHHHHAVRRVSAAEASAFSLLRQPAAAAVPAAVVGFTTDPTIAARYAPNASLARLAHPAGDPSASWYLIPGEDSLCFYADGAGRCTSLADADAGRLMLWGVRMPAPGQPATADDGPALVEGIAPDSFSAASATSPSGTVSTQIGADAYELRGTDLTALTLSGSAGAHTIQLQP